MNRVARDKALPLGSEYGAQKLDEVIEHMMHGVPA